jgi:Ribbon-helix-helix protein, copG family
MPREIVKGRRLARSTKMGRPVSVGATAFVGSRFPVALVEAIDNWAKAEGIGRSEAVRRLIEAGLKRRPKL